MIRTMLFDLDNTLVYVEDKLRYNMVADVLKRLGHPAWSDHDVDYFWLKPDRSAIIKSHGVDPESFWHLFNSKDAIDSRIAHTRIFPDTWVLEELKEKGVRLGLVTGTVPWLAEAHIKMFNDGLFEENVICHHSRGFREKPSPDGIELCMKNMNADRKTAAYVGNADEDILAARAAGIQDILIRRNPDFVDQKATVTIDNLEELLEMV